ncbi:MAG TPA: histidine phosphatase family protein [Actinomycetota bacterium]|nr:histidine phosphatase family protein [Actinomycetota bacterium]
MDATIHLIRHGEVANPKNVIYGRLPGYHLSERGARQAEAAAEHLATNDIGAIWVSPLERAQETAAPIAESHSLEIVTDERLIESGTTLEGVGRTMAAFFRSPRHWWSLRNPLRPSWGESFAEIKSRVDGAIGDAVEAAGGREVVIVTHQTPVVVARQSLTKAWGPPWLRRNLPRTGSITTVVVENGRAVSASYYEPPA